MTSRGFRRALGSAALAAIFAALAASSAAAQRLPVGLGLPNLPVVGPVLQGTTGIINRTTGELGSTVSGVTRDVVGRPHVGGSRFEKDPNGARVVRSEVLALSPNDQSLAVAQTLKFQVLRTDKLDSLGLTVAVLQVPDDMSVTDALAALRKADPAGAYDYNHIYDPSSDAANVSSDKQDAPAPAAFAGKIGMIDGGLDRRHRVFSDAKIVTKNLAGSNDSVATAHGTEVASLLVGDDDDFHGAVKGATLYAADVYGGQATGGAADDIARALAWLAANDVPVANISLAGPPNAVLQAAVGAYMKRGAVLVAAVGNDGPAAPAEYPAAYPGVVGVTSVDAEHKIQIDANRGPDVMFAALGVGVRAAAPNNEFAKVTGTSFAAPVVAARFAILMPKTDETAARHARTMLEHDALKLGVAAKDPVFGYGFLGRPGEILATASAR